VELTHLLDRKPGTLSGGEKQRVALGRCITRDPTLFLVDEPFANLDQALREKYRVNLKILLKQFHVTAVYVTHDHHEALILADLLAIMNHGVIEQVGTPEEIYDAPRNVFVAGFMNLHVGAPPISLIDARYVSAEAGLENTWVGVRPEDVEIFGEPRSGRVRATIAGALHLPPRNTALVTIRMGEHEVHAQSAADVTWVAGEPVWLAFKRYHVFDRGSGARLRSQPAVR
jgi:multiple sugar transport system ATP-binding protein